MRICERGLRGYRSRGVCLRITIRISFLIKTVQPIERAQLFIGNGYGGHVARNNDLRRDDCFYALKRERKGSRPSNFADYSIWPQYVREFVSTLFLLRRAGFEECVWWFCWPSRLVRLIVDSKVLKIAWRSSTFRRKHRLLGRRYVFHYPKLSLW